MTDIADPPIPAPPAPDADQAAPAPEASSRFVPVLGLVALVAVVWHFFGPWGLAMVGALLGSIFLHEMGHFLTAKQAGMKVTEYFIGVGPRIWSFRRGETEYGVKAIPVAAYVRIVGMSDLEEVDPRDGDRTYRSKGYWARLRVVLAGPFMNFAIAIVALFVFFAGVGNIANTGWHVKEVSPSSAAAAAGVHPGDRIVSFDGHKVTDWGSFSKLLAHQGGKPATVVVDRGGQTVVLTPTIGWALTAAGAAKLAPLTEGDTVTDVGPVKGATTSIATYAELRAALAKSHGETTVKFRRDDGLARTVVTGPIQLPAEGSRGLLGVARDTNTRREMPFEAGVNSFKEFASLGVGGVQGITKLFSPSGLAHYTQDVVGQSQTTPHATAPAPVVVIKPGAHGFASSASSSADDTRVISILGILRLGSQAGESSLGDLLRLIALLNVFLGLVNLLPLPPFDGGHAAVATYEAIRGKFTGRPYRADVAKLLPVAYAVIAVFAFLGLSSIYLDAFRPVANPYGGP